MEPYETIRQKLQHVAAEVTTAEETHAATIDDVAQLQRELRQVERQLEAHHVVNEIVGVAACEICTAAG